MAINFPATPTNGQIYTDTTSNQRYVYNSTYSSWQIDSFAIQFQAGQNTQILFSQNNFVQGSNGLTYVASSNTVYANTLYLANTAFISGLEVGFLEIPQNSQSAAYTLTINDSGKHILHPASDTTARTFTIPANSSVSFPIGSAVSFVNMSTGNVTIAITTDTMYLSGNGTVGATGSRTLTQYGSATILKVNNITWLISGSGLV